MIYVHGLQGSLRRAGTHNQVTLLPGSSLVSRGHKSNCLGQAEQETFIMGNANHPLLPAGLPRSARPAAPHGQCWDSVTAPRDTRQAKEALHGAGGAVGTVPGAGFPVSQQCQGYRQGSTSPTVLHYRCWGAAFCHAGRATGPGACAATWAGAGPVQPTLPAGEQPRRMLMPQHPSWQGSRLCLGAPWSSLPSAGGRLLLGHAEGTLPGPALPLPGTWAEGSETWTWEESSCGGGCSRRVAGPVPCSVRILLANSSWRRPVRRQGARQTPGCILTRRGSPALEGRVSLAGVRKAQETQRPNAAQPRLSSTPRLVCACVCVCEGNVKRQQ